VKSVTHTTAIENRANIGFTDCLLVTTAPPPIVDAFACARAIDFLRFCPFLLSLDVPSSHFVRWILKLFDAHPGPETAQIFALGVFSCREVGHELTNNLHHIASSTKEMI
jgi:hypothetical protein